MRVPGRHTNAPSGQSHQLLEHLDRLVDLAGHEVALAERRQQIGALRRKL